MAYIINCIHLCRKQRMSTLKYRTIAIFVLLSCGYGMAAMPARGKQSTSFSPHKEVSHNPHGCEKQGGQKRQQFVPGEVLVKFKAGLTREEIDGIRKAYGLSLMKRIESIGVYRFKIPPGSTVEDMVDALKKDPHVEYAEPNYTVSITDR